MNKQQEKQLEIYKERLKIINLEEESDYEIISEYIKSDKYVTFKFTDKDNISREFKMSPNNFFNNGYRFPKNFTKNKGIEQFKKEVFNLVGNEYSILGDYINSQIKISIKHNVCGRTYSIQPNEFLQGKRCSKCSGRMKLNTSIFKERVFKLVGSEYTVEEEYVNSDTPIKITHVVCGNTFTVPPKEFTGKKQRRCPYCNGLSSGISIGAAKVKKSLEKLNVAFKREKRHLINTSIRRFDFMIKDSNLYIEFDGQQHFDKNKFTFKNFKSNSLEEIQRIDDEKNN